MELEPTYQDLFEQVLEVDRDSERLKAAELLVAEGSGDAADLMDRMTSHLAILDKQGVILETNRAWRTFGINNSIDIPTDSRGVDYLALCDSVRGPDANTATRVADGLRSVLGGELEEFVIDYGCDAPDVRRWFYMRAVPLEGYGKAKLAIIHKDITSLKVSIEALEERQAQLKTSQDDLHEVNIALKVLLNRKEQDHQEVLDRVRVGIEELVQPYLDKLRACATTSERLTYLEIIESNLHEVISPLLGRLSQEWDDLTPQEMRVAILVKRGKASKEIAEILHISISAVGFHRKSLRRKFGLTLKKINLRSHLLTLERPISE